MNQDVELTRGQLLGFLRHGLPLALVFAALFGAALFYWGSRAAPAFRAQVALVAKSPQVDLRTLGLPEVNYAPLHVSAYSVAVSSRPLLAAALAEAGLPNDVSAVTELAGSNLKVDVQAEAELVYVTVTEDTATRASDLANAIAERLQAWDRSRITDELQRVANLLTQRIVLVQMLLEPVQGEPAGVADQVAASNRQLLNQLSDQREAVLALMSSAPSTLTVLRAATPPMTSISRHPATFALLGAIVGALLAYGCMFLYALFSPRIYTSEELERAAGLRVLVELPRPKGPEVLAGESAITLQSNLKSAAGSGSLGTLLVVALEAKDDSAGAAMALAESCALRGMSTLLVDADVRSPEIARRYRVPGINHLPLTACLRGTQGALRPSTVLLDSRTSLSLVFESKPIPNEAVAVLNGLPDCLARWRAEYDCVVVRGAPLAVTSDVLLVGDSFSGVVLAADPRHARRRRLLAAIARLRSANVPLQGIIATTRRPKGSQRAARRAYHPTKVSLAASPRPHSKPPHTA